MASPARLHKQREEARIASERAAERQETIQGSEHELALAQLAAHKRQLSAIQSMQARQAKKAELMQEWHGYIDGVLAADAGVPDPVISQMMPWAFDVGDIDRALAVGDYLLRYKLPAPEQFTRDLPSLYAEMAAESWLSTPTGTIPAISAEQLGEVLGATADHDMDDEIRAKLPSAKPCTAKAMTKPPSRICATPLNSTPKWAAKPCLRSWKKSRPRKTKTNNPHTRQLSPRGARRYRALVSFTLSAATAHLVPRHTCRRWFFSGFPTAAFLGRTPHEQRIYPAPSHNRPALQRRPADG